MNPNGRQIFIQKKSKNVVIDREIIPGGDSTRCGAAQFLISDCFSHGKLSCFLCDSGFTVRGLYFDFLI